MEFFSLIIEKLTAWFNWKHKGHVNSMADRIERFMLDAQAQARMGAVGYSPEMLEQDGVFEVGERETAKEAIDLLYQKGKLELSDGRYYTKGNVPKF